MIHRCYNRNLHSRFNFLLFVLSVAFAILCLSLQANAETRVSELTNKLSDDDSDVWHDALDTLDSVDKNVAVEALTDAIKVVNNRRQLRTLATTLRDIDPGEKSARDLVEAVKDKTARSKYSIYGLIPSDMLAKIIPRNDWLDYKLSILARRRNITNIDLTLNGEEEKALREEGKLDSLLFPEEGTREIIEKSRVAIVKMMIPRLRDNGGRTAALVLGYLKEKNALSHLKVQFMEYRSESDDERGAGPIDISPAKFPEHHCFEQAIMNITGRRIHDVIEPSDVQLEQLRERFTENSEDIAALYVLNKLKPEILQEIVCSEFRNSSVSSRNEIALLLEKALNKGLSASRLKELLGEPNLIRNEIEANDALYRFAAESLWDTSWAYECIIENNNEALHLFLKDEAYVDLWYPGNSSFRSFAKNRLSQLGDEIIPMLIRGLKSEDSDVLKFTVSIIGNMGSSASGTVPTLIDLLESDSVGVRRKSLIALDAIGPDAHAAADALKKSLEDEDLIVRLRAKQALSKIRTQNK